MRKSRARNAGLLLGLGLGALLDAVALQELMRWTTDAWAHRAGWLAVVAGVAALWSALRGPGPLPAGASFLGCVLLGWGAANAALGVAHQDWFFVLIAGTGVLAAGAALASMRHGHSIERRSGAERRSASPLR